MTTRINHRGNCHCSACMSEFSRATNNNWIEHDGRECPVDLEASVKIKSRDGYTAVGLAMNFMRERWKHAPHLHPDCHIVAYRVVPTSPTQGTSHE